MFNDTLSSALHHFVLHVGRQFAPSALHHIANTETADDFLLRAVVAAAYVVRHVIVIYLNMQHQLAHHQVKSQSD